MQNNFKTSTYSEPLSHQSTKMNSISINSPGAFKPFASIATSSPPMSHQSKQLTDSQRKHLPINQQQYDIISQPTSSQSRLNSRQKAWLRKEVSSQISSARRMIDNASNNRKNTEFKQVSAKHLASPQIKNPKNQMQQAKVLLNAQNIRFQHPRGSSCSQQQKQEQQLQNFIAMQRSGAHEVSQLHSQPQQGHQIKQLQESPVMQKKKSKNLKQRLNISKMLDQNQVFVPSDLQTLVLLYGGSSQRKGNFPFQFSVSTNTSAVSSRLAAANVSMSTTKKSARGLSSDSHEKYTHTPSKERARTARLVQKCYEWNRVLAGMPNSGRRGSTSTPTRQNKADVQKIKRAAADILASRMNNIWRKAFYYFIVNFYRGKGGDKLLYSKLGYPWKSTHLLQEQQTSNNRKSSARRSTLKRQSIGDQVQKLANSDDRKEKNFIHSQSSLKRYMNPRERDALDYDNYCEEKEQQNIDDIRRSELQDIVLRKQMFEQSSGLMDERQMPLNLQKQSIYLPSSKNNLSRTSNDRILMGQLRQSKIHQTLRPAEQQLHSRGKSSNPNSIKRNKEMISQDNNNGMQYRKQIPKIPRIISAGPIQDLNSIGKEKSSIRYKFQNLLLSQFQGGQGSPSQTGNKKCQAIHNFSKSPLKQSRNNYNQREITNQNQILPNSVQVNVREDLDNLFKETVTSARLNSFRQTESREERENF